MNRKQRNIEIQPADDDGYYFSFALLFHKIFVSKFFEKTSDATIAINSMRSDVLVDTLIRKYTSPTGGVYFVLYNSKGESVGQSTTFDLVTHMEIAIEDLRKNFPLSPTIQQNKQ